MHQSKIDAKLWKGIKTKWFKKFGLTEEELSLILEYTFDNPIDYFQYECLNWLSSDFKDFEFELEKAVRRNKKHLHLLPLMIKEKSFYPHPNLQGEVYNQKINGVWKQISYPMPEEDENV